MDYEVLAKLAVMIAYNFHEVHRSTPPHLFVDVDPCIPVYWCQVFEEGSLVQAFYCSFGERPERVSH